MPKTVIINSTPIIALSSIDKLDLLKELYGTVIIPNAVKGEIDAKGGSTAKKHLEASSTWIYTRHIENVAQKQTFKTNLHDGEVEVMILGQELNADLLVIDDYMAREYAKYLEFSVVGTVGIILLAKSKELVSEVKPSVDLLIANGIYIGRRLYSEIMKIADE